MHVPPAIYHAEGDFFASLAMTLAGTPAPTGSTRRVA
jgi:hypothetical protein